MAAAPDAIWAVDLGNHSLKALHMVAVGDSVQVIGFDQIPHGKIVSGAGVGAAEREELLAMTLRQFVQRNEVGFDPLVISVASQNSFSRFVTVPPVEQKRLPEIVRYEAAQQIPFDMSEIQWDYQIMSDESSAEKRVGIFAIKNEIVNDVLEYFEREELLVNYVQMAPMALYNYLRFDRPELVGSDEKATVIINVGADSTDVIVCTPSDVWQRCIMMGGNAFTQAIAETFKLNFAKAEKLKRTAPVSKYARQIFQAMRPVFTDLAGEVQRSLGFYTSSNPDVKIGRVIAMGGGTKLRGLLKYLQQTLQMPVEKPDAFKRLAVAQGLSTAKFHENVGDFGVVYGLGVQGLGMARIESNLLPTSVARSMAWATKTRWFIAAAVLVFAVMLLVLGRVGFDHAVYARGEPIRSANNRDANAGQRVVDQAGEIEDETGQFVERIRSRIERFQYREKVPQLYEVILSALPNAENNPEQRALYEAFARGDIATVTQFPRSERKQLFITQVTTSFSDDLENAEFGQAPVVQKSVMTQGMEGQPEMIMDERYLSMMGLEAMVAEETTPGFVISVVGYSPYAKVGELIDPVGVEADRDRWGLVTRMERLDEFLDANSPFDLYSKAPDHYQLEIRLVDVEDSDLPVGIGVSEFIEAPQVATTTATRLTGATTSSGEMKILVDPMTGETMSSEMLRDSRGNPLYDSTGAKRQKANDYWFRLDFKLVWDDAPDMVKPPATTKR